MFSFPEPFVRRQRYTIFIHTADFRGNVESGIGAEINGITDNSGSDRGFKFIGRIPDDFPQEGDIILRVLKIPAFDIIVGVGHPGIFNQDILKYHRKTGCGYTVISKRQRAAGFTDYFVL